jgi:hypothetical protein
MNGLSMAWAIQAALIRGAAVFSRAIVVAHFPAAPILNSGPEATTVAFRPASPIHLYRRHYDSLAPRPPSAHAGYRARR